MKIISSNKFYLDVSFLVIQTSMDFGFTSSYCSLHLHYGRCYSMLKYWENSQTSVHVKQNCVMIKLLYKVAFDEGKIKCCSSICVSVCINDDECLCQKKKIALFYRLPLRACLIAFLTLQCDKKKKLLHCFLIVKINFSNT